MKIFVIGENLEKSKHKESNEFKNQPWIVDTLKNDIISQFPDKFTKNPEKADIIWFIAPWKYTYFERLQKKYLNKTKEQWKHIFRTKRVIFTMHHIDIQKMYQLEEQFIFMKMYGDRFHAICKNTQLSMEKYFPIEKIFSKGFWINPSKFYSATPQEKINIRAKFNFNTQAYLIGSFQKDSEGKTDLPKLSKGPDLFVNIVQDMLKNNKNIEVVLTGLRRKFIINRFKKLNIKYHYFNMVSSEDLSRLYRCLDLYIVSSRCEGGPYTILEAGISRTPLISTKVGVAPELCHPESLFDADNWVSYREALPKVEHLYNNVHQLSKDKYKEEFLKSLTQT